MYVTAVIFCETNSSRRARYFFTANNSYTIHYLIPIVPVEILFGYYTRRIVWESYKRGNFMTPID